MPPWLTEFLDRLARRVSRQWRVQLVYETREYQRELVISLRRTDPTRYYRPWQNLRFTMDFLRDADRVFLLEHISTEVERVAMSIFYPEPFRAEEAQARQNQIAMDEAIQHRIRAQVFDSPGMWISATVSGAFDATFTPPFDAFHMPQMAAADKKAEDLLLAKLNDDQRKQWLSYGTFTVIGNKTGMHYVLTKQRSYGIKVTLLGKVVGKMCVVASDPLIPICDQLLAQKLMIETDEENFVKLANP